MYGRTNNPWDRSRTAGGSSGGEGALVAAGAIPFGIGSDIGGSIRIPAALCGAAGHKPTGRMVPNTGIWPGVEGERSAYHVAGPITRRVGDLLPLLKILAGVLEFQAGSRTLGHNVDVAYFAQHQIEALNPANTVLEELETAAPRMTSAEQRRLLIDLVDEIELLATPDFDITVPTGGRKPTSVRTPAHGAD